MTILPARMKTSAPLLALTFAAVLPASAAVDFEKDVRPVLEFNCVRCHNPKGTEFEKGDTDLNLSSHDTATESKSTIVPGDPALAAVSQLLADIPEWKTNKIDSYYWY